MYYFGCSNPYGVVQRRFLSPAKREAAREAAAAANERLLNRFPFLDFRNDLFLVSSFFKKQHDLFRRRGHYYYESRRQALLDEFLRTIRAIPIMAPDYEAQYRRASETFIFGQDHLDEEWENEQRELRNRELAREASRRNRRRFVPLERRQRLHTRWSRWVRAVHGVLSTKPGVLDSLPLPPRGRIRPRRGAPVRRLCERSLLPPPTPEALLNQYERAKGWGRVEEKLRLGSMLLDLEASVDSSLIRDEEGEITGRNPGLRGWFRDHCRPLLRHYGSLMGYRRLAEEFRQAHGVSDPEPASVLLDEEEPEFLSAERRRALRPCRREARKRLASPAATTASAFLNALQTDGRRFLRSLPPRRSAARGRRRTE